VTQLTKSYSGAETVAANYPQYSSQIITAANESFVNGQKLAYTAGLIGMVVGTALVWSMYPDKRREIEMFESFAGLDAPPA
jgi:DHA2 family multidrug resistance protein-like MFS transporter